MVRVYSIPTASRVEHPGEKKRKDTPGADHYSPNRCSIEPNSPCFALPKFTGSVFIVKSKVPGVGTYEEQSPNVKN